MRERDDTTNESTPERDDRVGLGRVVEDRRAPTRDPGRPGAGSDDDDDEKNGIEEASEESFPASDPPTFMSDRPTPRDR